MKKISCTMLSMAMILGAFATPARAQEAAVSEEIRQLREQLQMLSQRLDQLEESNQQLRDANQALKVASDHSAREMEALEDATNKAVAQAEASAGKGDWTDSLSWTGDFRYRYENIKVEDDPNRNRSRIRARAALNARVNDELKVTIGIASGSDDPVSSNQTLGGGGSTKDLGLDLAYFDWSGLANTHILGGKMKNILMPVAKNSMLWDSDWRPEGTAFVFDNDRFFASGVGTWLESDSSKGSEFAWIAEGGVRFKLGDGTKLRVGIGYHQFDVAGSDAFFGDDDFFGNTSIEVNGVRQYAYDYHGLQGFAELGFSLFNMPATAWVDYVKNQEAPEFDTGYIFGLKLGSAKAPGSWDLSWAWEDLEADAALGLLTDSDFGGGGTDAKGHIFKGTWMFKKNFSGKFTYFINEIDRVSGVEKDFDRLMLDLNFKF